MGSIKYWNVAVGNQNRIERDKSLEEQVQTSVGIVGDEGSKDEGDDDHNEGEGVDDQQVEVSRLQMLQLPH